MIYNNNQKYNPSFNGITKIYALTDSHQDTRKTCALLSHLLKDAKSDKNVLFLNCGDMFKGIYPRQIEADSYVTLKQSKPDMEMVFTLGNNDFGFNKENLDFLINTIKRFTAQGIHTVCANIFEKLSISDLKSVFDNALKSYGYGSNAKFLQCSNNIKIEGKDNPVLKKFEVKQIFINEEALLDKNGQPLNPNRKFKCAIDSYIADGGQGFTTLQQAEKTDILQNNQPLKINEVLLDAIKNAPRQYKPNSEYPSFQLIEL